MLLDSLNPQQKQAVQHGDGPLIVVAGAGSGKTRVITSRIAYLIHERGVAPERILAITFTNKAAGEMKERIHGMLGDADFKPWISTFHSFCLRVLRQHIEALGRSKDFVIYDAQDQLSLLKQCMKSASANEDAFPPKTLLHHISSFKNDFLMPKDIDRDALPFGNKMKAAELYPVYQEALKKNNALDFDDLLFCTVRLLAESEPVSRYYNERFQHILVDEFQDTNLTQYKLLRLLTAGHRNVCVVGDDDQSIYRWRGANLENLLHFEKDYPGTVVIKLEENYRSTQNILKAAGAVVEENHKRRPKTLWTQNEAGEPVRYYRAEDEIDEARSIGEKIIKYNEEEGISFSDMAVLYRTNAQSRVVEDTLRSRGIQHQVIGGLKFYARKEIKDILSFMRVVLNPDDSISLKRIINVPARGIGKTSLDKIDAHCAENNLSFMEGLKAAGAITSKAVGNKIAKFVTLVEELDSIYHSASPLDFLREVMERTGYLDMLRKDGSPESQSRMENLQELYTALEQEVEKNNVTLPEFLDTTALVADVDTLEDSRGVLPLMTLHTCKGLEFDVAFIIGMEDGLLPHNSSMSDPDEFEEERRLCYVGFTRARKRLIVSNARRRKIYGNHFNYPPSQFLASIPDDVLVTERSAAAPNFESRRPAYAVSEPVPSASAAAPKEYSIGSKVLHPTFGKGVVINRMGNEADLKVEIFFKPPHGKKKLAVKLAKLIPL